MPKDNSNKGNEKFEKGGYRPLNVGYTPEEKRGSIPSRPSGALPKPPKGGTGESPPLGSPTSSKKTST